MGAVRYTPANTSTGGTSGSSTAQLIQPLDLNGANNGNPLLLVNSINALGAITATNYYNPVTMTLTGLPAGTASIKVQTDLDVYSIVLQDTLVKFIREYFIADGGATAYTKDITLAGAPYTPIGAVTAVTAGDASAANQIAGNNSLTNIFGNTSDLVTQNRPIVERQNVIAGGTAVLAANVLFLAAYNAATGAKLTIAELAVLGAGVNAAMIKAQELENILSSDKDSFKLLNQATWTIAPVPRNFTNSNAFTIIVFTVKYF